MAIFDITRDERTRLHGAILAAFPDPYGFGAFLLTVLDKHFDQITAVNSAYVHRVLDVIHLAHSEDWLSGLLTELCNARPQDPVLSQLREQLQPKLPLAGVDHYEACQLTGDHLMINRRLLRDGLRRLQSVNGRGKRILIVRGDSGSGKSHSMMLIAHLRENLGNFKLVTVNLEKLARQHGDPGALQAEHLGWKIISRMKGYETARLPAPDDRQRAKWVQEFCDEVEKVAADDPNTWWIAIDAFTAVLLSQSALDLVKELCLRVNLTLSRFRLILLDFQDSLDPCVIPNVEHESIGPIGKDELRDFFMSALQGSPAAQDPETLGRLVAATLIAAGTGDLAALSRAVHEQLHLELART